MFICVHVHCRCFILLFLDCTTPRLFFFFFFKLLLFCCLIIFFQLHPPSSNVTLWAQRWGEKKMFLQRWQDVSRIRGNAVSVKVRQLVWVSMWSKRRRLRQEERNIYAEMKWPCFYWMFYFILDLLFLKLLLSGIANMYCNHFTHPPFFYFFIFLGGVSFNGKVFYFQLFHPTLLPSGYAFKKKSISMLFDWCLSSPEMLIWLRKSPKNDRLWHATWSANYLASPCSFFQARTQEKTNIMWTAKTRRV